MFEAVITKEARRRFRKMPNNTQQTIVGKIASLATNPLAPNNNVQAVKGSDLLRLRVGDWRVLYRLDAEAKTMTIIEVLPRGDAYR